MRTITLWLGLSIWLVGASYAAQDQPASQLRVSSPNRADELPHVDVDRPDPINLDDWRKIVVLLRREDIPVAKRIEYARYYIQREYPSSDEYTDKERTQALVITDAVWAIARLNHVESIPFLEERLEFWRSTYQREQQSPSVVRTPLPDMDVVRVALARLKAVRDIPEVKTSQDLIERLKRKLHHVGFQGSIEEWLQALSKELEVTYNAADMGIGIHEKILLSYFSMLMEAGWKGVDIDAAAKVIHLDWKQYPNLHKKFESLIQLAKVPRAEVGRWIVEDALRWQVLSGAEAIKAQVLLGLGTSVVPIIQEKLSWALRNRDQIEGTGIGLAALAEVLVTLVGERALPFIEPLTQDKNEWVRHYACRAKEYIQQGKVFAFAPYF